MCKDKISCKYKINDMYTGNLDRSMLESYIFVFSFNKLNSYTFDIHNNSLREVLFGATFSEYTHLQNDAS